MMYNNGLAFAVKVGGKILREVGDQVFIPFGSEYSLVIKNQKHERALIHISIDGQAIDSGGGFIVDGKKTVDIERFVKDLSKGNRFKFIERTKKIEDGPRGVKLEDGLITVDFQFENPAPKYEDHHVYQRVYYHNDYWHGGCYGPHHTLYGASVSNTLGGSAGGSSFGGGGGGGGLAGSTHLTSTNSADSVTCSTVGTRSAFNAQVKNDAGITVAGSESQQQFSTGYIFNLNPAKYSMTIRLLGSTGEGKAIAQPYTVKSKKVCVTCGTHNKHSSKFCRECGTALDII